VVAEAASVVVASMEVVAVVSMVEDPLAVLQAESACAAVESALAERASQAPPRTLLAQGRGSLPWVIRHPDSLLMMDGLIDPLPPTLRAIAPQWLQQCVHRKHFRNAE